MSFDSKNHIDFKMNYLSQNSGKRSPIEFVLIVAGRPCTNAQPMEFFLSVNKHALYVLSLRYMRGCQELKKL